MSVSHSNPTQRWIGLKLLNTEYGGILRTGSLHARGLPSSTNRGEVVTINIISISSFQRMFDHCTPISPTVSLSFTKTQ
jgi:hypothetical protein